MRPGVQQGLPAIESFHSGSGSQVSCEIASFGSYLPFLEPSPRHPPKSANPMPSPVLCGLCTLVPSFPWPMGVGGAERGGMNGQSWMESIRNDWRNKNSTVRFHSGYWASAPSGTRTMSRTFQLSTTHFVDELLASLYEHTQVLVFFPRGGGNWQTQHPCHQQRRSLTLSGWAVKLFRSRF